MKMKSFKKIMAMTLTCVILLAVLAGCAASHNDWEDIGPKGKMIIGITDFPPMNYKDGDGKWIGFESEFADAVCAKLGVTAEFQIIEWGAKETELKAKNIDCVWNGMTVTSEREKNMDMSAHYMKNRQVLVTKAENLDKYKTADALKDASVVAEADSTGEETVQKDEFFAQANYTAVDSQIKALMEIKSGNADVAVVDYLIAANAMGAGTDFTDLVITETKFPDEEYAIAFRKNSPVTKEKVDNAIQELKDSGEFQAIADKYGLGDLIIK